jgi:hypothetical protein
MYIFLDESGDLGFDLSKTGTSKFFTITVLVIENQAIVRTIEKAVKRTLDKKINHKRKGKNLIPELKATETSQSDKKYFLDKMPEHGWHLYGITLNKINVYDYLQRHKSKLYNFIVKELIETLPKYDTLNHIHFTLDNCKNKAERKDFNSYIKTYLETHFSLNTKIHITHENSQNNLCLQAVDLLCWGIQRKFELKDKEFFKLYENKIVKHIPYLF